MRAAALYIRNIICFLCFFQVFLHLVPKEQYQKYLKLFGNLILVFLLLRPVTAVFGMEEHLEDVLSRELRNIEYGELKLHVKGVEELRTQIVNQAYEEEVKKQIRTIPPEYGLSVVSEEVIFDEEMMPENIRIRVLEDGNVNMEERIDDVKEALQNVYGLSTDKILITVRE